MDGLRQIDGISGGIWFVYDGDCPICSSAAQALRIKRDYGKLHVLNARTEAATPLVQEITRRGFDLDEGMVIFANGRFYHGKDALRFMARYGALWRGQQHLYRLYEKPLLVEQIGGPDLSVDARAAQCVAAPTRGGAYR